MGHFFSGVPAPGGAFLAMTPIYLANSGLLTEAPSAQFAMFFVPIVAGLMGSTWPTFSAKSISRKILRLFILAVFDYCRCLAVWIGDCTLVYTFGLCLYLYIHIAI